MVVGIAIPVKTQCSIRVMDRVLVHGFKKDLGPGLCQAYIWLLPFGEHPLASTRGRKSSRPAFYSCRGQQKVVQSSEKL